jgi:hypothetical protein
MARMQALVRYRHRGVMYKPGETFPAPDEDEARDLIAVGFARWVAVPAIEQPPVPAPGQEQRAAPAAYDRRDLRARE